jgi:glycosyltransferase involved in cell wall biosynthesis
LVRVGIDIRELERGKMTGIGRSVRNFIAYAKKARPGHGFFLYGNQHTDTSLEGDNAVLRVQRERSTLWWDQRVLAELAHQDGVEVFFSPYLKGPLGVHCPLVITVHDLIDLAFPEYARKRRLKNIFLKGMTARTGQRAERVLADSGHAAGDAVRLLGLERTRIQVLPLGVEARYRPVGDGPEGVRALRRYGLEEPYILYVGNFKPHKNVPALLRAFADLEKGLRDQYLLALGGHQDRWCQARRKLAEELGIGARTRFLGPIAEEDLPALYSQATLFAFPSLYEGFGLPPLEAMACGAPVLCSSRTSLPEVVGQAGRLEDPEDGEAFGRALGELLADREERLRLAAAGLERARLFRAEDMCERQMQILEQVATEGRR